MKKPDSFPYEHKAGGMVFQIYLAPLFKTAKNGEEARYESFLVTHHEGGRRVQKRRANWNDVETYVEEVVVARRKNDPESLELSGRDRRIYLAALEAVTPLKREVDDVARELVAAAQQLAPHGLSVAQAAHTLDEALKKLTPHGLGVTEAAQMVHDALEKLEKTPLSTAVDFYKRHGATMTATRNVPEVVEELLKELKNDDRGEYHKRDMRLRLGRFKSAFPGPIHLVEEREITEWLQGLKKTVWKKGEKEVNQDETATETKAKRIENPDGKPVEKRTRNNYRDAVYELFEFAKKRGYVSRDLPTAAEGTVRMKVVPGKNHIISPEEARRALGSLPPYLIPFTVLELFSGLRTEEAFGLQWDELRFSSNAVIIEAKLAKLRQRRVPPILPNLAKWLRPFRKMKGLINPGYSSPQGVQKAVIRESKKVGVILKRNTFRNCYISYRVAQPTECSTVAEETGTSKRMIESNYKELTTKPEAKKWFSICPTKAQMVELTKWANDASRAVNGDEPGAMPKGKKSSPAEAKHETEA